MPDLFNSSSSKIPTKSHPVFSHHKEESKAHSFISAYLNGKDVHKIHGHSHNPLASYNLFPDKVVFSNADNQEKIVMLLRKHPITNIPWLFSTILLLTIPPFLPFFPLISSLAPSYQNILSLIWYMITLMFVIEKFLYWFFNVDLVTDERIIDISFHNIMYREITAAKIDEIQEITVKPTGGIESFFDYGDVLIQTAAEIPRIVFKKVPHPEKVEKILRDLGIQEEIEKLEGRVR